jgi:hypothetical protein
MPRFRVAQGARWGVHLHQTGHRRQDTLAGVSPLFSVDDGWDRPVGTLARAGFNRGAGRPSGPRVSGPAQWPVSISIFVFPFILFTDLNVVL